MGTDARNSRPGRRTLLTGTLLAALGPAAALLVWAAAESPHGPMDLDCVRCHSTAGWALRPDPAFHHDRDTAWPLEGGHAAVACALCHPALRFPGTASRCRDCHLDVHEGGLGDDCGGCHTPARWLDPEGLAARHRRTLFPLTGAHARTPCARCHPGTGAAQFTGTPLDCAACHLAAWRATTAPPHAGSGLGTACGDCHDTRRWSDAAGFRHAAFPLEGAHRAAPCAACHADGVFAGTPGDCWSCHQADYQSARDPDHAAGGYPHSCGVCHGVAAWRPAAVDHDRTAFPLTGAHLALPCAACHAGGYSGTPTACQACHLGDYQATTNPAHDSAGFPLDCASCHSTATWSGATFDHDQRFFPIYSGSHRSEWTSCADCHTNPGDYSQFSCLGCHEHSRSSMDGEHEGVAGYSYHSQACLDCHPDGRGDDAFPAPPLHRRQDNAPRPRSR